MAADTPSVPPPTTTTSYSPNNSMLVPLILVTVH
jgi:hypothetical protein